jgi:hypothetical protein
MDLPQAVLLLLQKCNSLSARSNQTTLAKAGIVNPKQEHT